MATRIVIAEGSFLVREGIRRVLDRHEGGRRTATLTARTRRRGAGRRRRPRRKDPP